MTPSASPNPLCAIQLQGVTRSAFIFSGALAVAGAYGLAAVSPFVGQALAQGGGDADILNLALTLEHVEAAFYREAVAQLGNAGSDLRTLVRHLHEDEVAHVGVLRAAVKKLGGTPALPPPVRFGGAFASTAAFLRVASMLEETGVSAYNALAPKIASKDVLAAAGSIVQVEARHASLIHLAQGTDPSPLAFDKPASKRAVLGKIAPLLGGAG